MVKTCSKCGVAKECSDFGKNKNYADGYRGQCNECRRKIQMEVRQSKEGKEYLQNYYEKRNQRDRQRRIDKGEDYRQSQDKVNEWHRQRRKEKPHIGRWRGILKSTLRSLGTSKHADTLLSLLAFLIRFADSFI